MLKIVFKVFKNVKIPIMYIKKYHSIFQTVRCLLFSKKSEVLLERYRQGVIFYWLL